MRQMTVRRRRLVSALGVGAVAALTAACAGAPAPSSSAGISGSGSGSADGGAPSASAPTSGFTVLTPTAKTQVDALTWAVYRETQTLDPIQAFDYPENTVVPLLCDAMLRTGPDMTLGPGLTTMTNPSPTKLDFTINKGATFWDGKPVTTDDVLFSLKRSADPKGGGFYASVFDRVESMTAIGADTVEISLKQPDYWLPGELSSTAGSVVQKAYAEAKGKDFGTVTGGVMCSGPFKLDSWKTGQGVTVVPNATYWDAGLPKPKFNKLTIIGVPDDATFTAGVQTGSISGGWYNPLSTLAQLQSNPKVNVYQGAPTATAAMVISAKKGPLANVKVRQAISYALDRKGLIATVFKGAATVPHALMASGSWGYAQDTFKAGYDALPALDQDLTKAQALIKEANVAGQNITIGTSSGIPALNTEALAFKAAAESLGLKVTLNSVSPSNYINFFIDPKAWESVDAFPTTNYGDYADPSAFYKSIVFPTGSQDFSGYSNPQVDAAMNAARSEADPVKRAEFTVAAQKIITDEMVWIPEAAPNSVLIMNKAVTGPSASFSYMFGPWAVYLGGS
jgi:peptide/nickel transport system substrate-binding protein